MICKTSDNLNIYYEVQGNEQATESIIFLNGLSQTTVSWILAVPYLKEKYKIILMDFIFQGKSDKESEWRDFDTHAKDVISLLDHLKIKKTHVVGLSYGSIVAQNLSFNYPERISKLILISTFAHKTPYYEAVELSWWRALEFGGYHLMLDIMLPSVLSENYFSHPLIPIDLMKQMRQDGTADTQSLFKLMRATKERGDYRPNLQKIKTTTLIIQGEKDALFPVHIAQEVEKAMPNSTLKVIANCGHTINLEAVPKMCELIIEFLK